MFNMKTHQHCEDAASLAPEIEAVIELFNNDLKGISFPDVSRETLAKQAEAYRSLSREVAAAAATLSKLREEASGAEAVLRQTTQRGLAYASIYAGAAADRLGLAATVTALQQRIHVGAQAPLPRGADASPKRRGRKSSTVGDSLFPPASIAAEQTSEFTCETGD